MESYMAYNEMGDDLKIEQSIKFIALGQPLPIVLETFLKEAGLYDLLVNELPDEKAKLYQAN